MIYRFTNVHGRCQYGVVIRMHDDGAYVLADAWWPTEKVQVDASYAYVSLTPNPYVFGNTSHDLLPLDTPVAWQTPEIRQIVELMRAGSFDAWWQVNEPMIVRKFIGGYSPLSQ